MGTQRLKTCLLLLAGLLALALPTSALAITGQYEVSACNYTLEGANNSWVWESTDTSEHDHYAEHSNCPDPLGGTGGNIDREGGLSTTDALHLSNGAPTGTSAGWTDTVPKGTTIAAIKYERYIGLNYDPYPNSWSPALRADDTIINNETCEDTPANSYVCFIGGPPGHGGEPSTITGLSAHKLTLGIDCHAEAGAECITGASQYDVWAAMYGATVTINDPTPPTLQTPTGNLWEAGEHNGYHTGTETLSTSAQDTGGGVQTITLAVDGKPNQTYDAPCDFTYTQPCPTSTGPQTFTLNTSQLSDGPHALILTAVDAAGNDSTVATNQITVANNPPPAPTMLIATATQPGSNTYTATWKDPANQPIPVTSATYQLCPIGQPAECTTPAQAPLEGPVTIILPGPRTWTLSVWLTNAAGLTSSNNAATTQILLLPGPEISPAPGHIEGPRLATNTGSPLPPSQHHDAQLHLSGRIHGQYLFVQLTGPSTGRVKVAYAVRYHHRTIARASKSISLRHGHQTTRFKLPGHIIAHITILVYARLARNKAQNTISITR